MTTHRNRGEILAPGQWDPTTHPFRLSVTRQSSQAGCFGWRHDTPRMFKSLDDAKAEAALGQGRGVISVCVDEAVGFRIGQNGKWVCRFKRTGRGK